MIKVLTSFNIDLEFEVPEFWRRFAAWLIDVVIELAYLLISSKIFNTLMEGTGGNDGDEIKRRAIGFMFMLPIFLYHLVCEIAMNGQSVGKRIAGLRVVTENGGRASISQFLIRWFLRLSDVWIVILILILPFIVASGGRYEGILFFLGGVAFLVTDISLVVATKKGQRLGDILAKTIIIRIQNTANIEETVFMAVADNYVPVFPQIMQLSDRDINAIKGILETARKRGDHMMALSAADKIKGHLGIQTAMPPFDFLDVLLKDYNFLSTK